MPVPTYQEPIEVYSGDGWAQTFYFSTDGVRDDLSSWVQWRSQWRPNRSSQTVIDLTVDSTFAVDGEITVRATGVQTRAMGRDGIADLQGCTWTGAEPETLIRFSTLWHSDVTL